MVHGQLVTEADLRGLLDATHPRGYWRRGFGRDVLASFVGVATHYEVDTSTPGGDGVTVGQRGLRTALQSTSKLLVTVKPGLGAVTVNPGDFTARWDKFVDGRGALLRTDGAGQMTVQAGFHDGAVFGWCDVQWRMGNSAGDDSLHFEAGNVPGRGFILGMWGDVTDGDDEAMNIVQPPQAGFYFSLIGLDWPINENPNQFGLIVGNNPTGDEPQHTRNAAMRGTLAFNNWHTRVRHPNMNGAHIDSVGNRRRVLLNPIIIRRATAILRSRQEVWVGPPENPSNNAPINIEGGAWVRVEGARRITDTGMAAIAENNRNAVTDAAIYVDEGGASLASYNDIAELVSLAAAMGDDELNDYIAGFSGWFDTCTVAAPALVAGALAGLQVSLTTEVDTLPAWDAADKALFLDFVDGGAGWAALRAVLGAGDVAVAGNTVTLTFPVGANAIAFPADEDVLFGIPSELTTRSAHMWPDERVTIASGGGGGGAPTPWAAANAYMYRELVRAF
jgi:hypothetical protein